MPKLKDIDVRRAVHDSLQEYHEDPDTLVLDELGLCQGAVRIDVAVVNGSIQGYEIKSEKDTLDRLAGQASVYNKTLDYVTIVCGENHLHAVRQRIPDFWGISVARARDERVQLDDERPPKFNVNVDALSVAQLLWKEEALSLLSGIEDTRGLASKPRAAVWSKLVEVYPLEDLRRLTRTVLKHRASWRSGSPRT